MFSKAKDAPEKPKMKTQSQPQQTRRNVKSAPSIISADMTVNGTLTATGDIQVDGTVEGDISSASLTIGEKATVHGEVISEDVVIRGRVIGSVRANRVQLSSSSHVEGDIYHQALAVETGAFFEGNCRHSDNPMAESGGGGRGSRKVATNPLEQGGKPAMAHESGAKSPPRPARNGGGGRAPVEAQSALQRLTGSSGRKGQD